jgi:iron-sulfur cluster repair protein YtfE (RIC family)
MITIGRRAPVPADLVGHLLACHERIRKFVAVAAKAASAAGRDQEVVEACAAVERYFERALPLHVEDEERSILPQLQGRRIDVDQALRTMEDQHRAHGPLVIELLAASRSVRQSPADPAGRERLRAVAVQLSAEFEPHLAVEERIIFPAVSLLDAEVQAQIRNEQRARRDAVPSAVP